MISVSLFGAGNLAFHLFNAFYASKSIFVNEWYARNTETIKSYRNKVNIIESLKDLKPSDIYIIAISDDAIPELTSKIPTTKALVVHTSGSVGIHDINKKHRRAIFYPLQTFTKERPINFKDVPFCIEVLEKNDLKILSALAESIGSKHYKTNADQRKALHLAAVYANNFTNQLYRISHEITESASADFNVLKPLIRETAHKIQLLSPYRAQTGPAKRNDQSTIKRHLKQLKNEDHKNIYALLTQSIQNTHGNKKL